MSGYNGSGTYVRGYNWVNDAAAAIPITASRVDADMADVVSGFNLAVTRDGQGKITANFPMNNYSLIGLNLGTSGSPSVSFNGGSSIGIYAVGANGPVGLSGGLQLNAPASGTAAALVASAGAATTPVAVTYGTTTILNASASNVFTTTLTGNITTLTITNPTDGQTINWFLTQDATGSRTMAWGTSLKWAGGTAGVLSTGAAAVDLFTAVYRASTGFWYCSLGKAFS